MNEFGGYALQGSHFSKHHDGMCSSDIVKVGRHFVAIESGRAYLWALGGLQDEKSGAKGVKDFL